MRVLPRPRRATRLRGRHPRGAVKPKGVSPEDSSVVTAPWWESRRPSARGRPERRSRAELPHPRHDSSGRRGGWRKRDGLLRGSRLPHHHHQDGTRRHHPLRPSPGHGLLHRHRKRRWPRTPTRGPRGPQQGGRPLAQPGPDGSGTATRKQSSKSSSLSL
jgi:hypothetical protein